MDAKFSSVAFEQDHGIHDEVKQLYTCADGMHSADHAPVTYNRAVSQSL